MSKIRSDEIAYHCEGHGYMLSNPCPGHTICIEHHLGSDTFTVVHDGRAEMCLDDAGYGALEDAIQSMIAKNKDS